MFDGRHGPACAVIAPSGPGASSAAEAEALFAEAHRRRRRRRLAGVACLLLAGSAAAGLITARSGDGARTHHGYPGAPAPSKRDQRALIAESSLALSMRRTMRQNIVRLSRGGFGIIRLAGSAQAHIGPRAAAGPRCRAT